MGASTLPQRQARNQAQSEPKKKSQKGLEMHPSDYNCIRKIKGPRIERQGQVQCRKINPNAPRRPGQRLAATQGQKGSNSSRTSIGSCPPSSFHCPPTQPTQPQLGFSSTVSPFVRRGTRIQRTDCQITHAHLSEQRQQVQTFPCKSLSVCPPCLAVPTILGLSA